MSNHWQTVLDKHIRHQRRMQRALRIARNTEEHAQQQYQTLEQKIAQLHQQLDAVWSVAFDTNTIDVDHCLASERHCNWLRQEIVQKNGDLDKAQEELELCKKKREQAAKNLALITSRIDQFKEVLAKMNRRQRAKKESINEEMRAEDWRTANATLADVTGMQ